MLPIVGLVTPLDLVSVYVQKISSTISGTISSTIRSISPEMIYEMLSDKSIVVRRPGVIMDLIGMLANNACLLDNIIKESSPTQLENFVNLLFHNINSLSSSELSGIVHSVSLDECLKNTKIIDCKIRDLAFKHAREGDAGKVIGLISGNKDFIYSEQNGKSLLEVVSDTGNPELVRYLILVHKELIEENKLSYTVNQDYSMMEKIKASLCHIAKVDHGEVIPILELNEELISEYTKKWTSISRYYIKQC
ncbi:MAG: hypothetical protein ACTJLM_05210 [Ehrlichia sp.]